MNTRIYVSIIVLLSLLVFTIQCEKKPMQPLKVDGNYSIDNDFLAGELTVKPLSNDKISFDVGTVTKHPGQHSALIEGEASIENKIATFQGEQGCKLTITFSPDQATITGADNTCRYYMGASAGVDGTYIRKK